MLLLFLVCELRGSFAGCSSSAIIVLVNVVAKVDDVVVVVVVVVVIVVAVPVLIDVGMFHCNTHCSCGCHGYCRIILLKPFWRQCR